MFKGKTKLQNYQVIKFTVSLFMVEKKTMFSHYYHIQEYPDMVSIVSIMKVKGEGVCIRKSKLRKSKTQ